MVKRLAGCIRQYRKDSILTPLFVIMEVVMEVVIPLLMANLIDHGIDEGNMGNVMKMGAALVVACVISLIFGALSGRSAAIASSGYGRNLRHDMYYSVQNYSFSSIDHFSTASLVTRLTTDVTNVQNAYQMIIRIAVRCPVMLIFSLIMAFNINPELSLIFLCAIPFLGTGLYIIMRKAHPVFERVFKTYDKLNNVVQENLRGIRVVKSYVREDHEIAKFGAVSERIYRDFSKAEKTLAYNMPLMQLSIYTCMLLVSWFGARMIVGSVMTTGQLMSLISYAMQILMSLMMLSMVFVMITISRASAERIVEILDEKNDIVNKDHPVYEVKDGGIVFDAVDFSYSRDQDKLCLKNVTIDIKPGETIGIIGGTGSSKTSFVQLIPRLYDATAGSVRVGGIDVRDYDIETLRNQVAMVLQKNVLFSGTIRENLRWGCEDAGDEAIIRACRLAQADDFIRAFPDGYDTYIEQGGTNVSGGQKQRLCLARALLKKPKILILDDSTSAVDTKTDAMIRKALQDEIPATTKVIIAQRISSIEHADQIIVMDNGRFSAVGTHEALLQTSAIYQEVYTSQIKGGEQNHVA
ncbi:MAG: ABC transporter ATP-binding protein [Clostridiaceae bacterium]|nr:ABC transporter ATP-binding protein [Clostridiaceae bacterium]